jgi:hypothetical protein
VSASSPTSVMTCELQINAAGKKLDDISPLFFLTSLGIVRDRCVTSLLRPFVLFGISSFDRNSVRGFSLPVLGFLFV